MNEWRALNKVTNVAIKLWLSPFGPCSRNQAIGSNVIMAIGSLTVRSFTSSPAGDVRAFVVSAAMSNGLS